MLKRFIPNEYVKSIFDIRPTALLSKGIKGIITDLDNTLVPWNVNKPTEEIGNWIKKMKDNGIQVTIISNNNRLRVKTFSDPIEIPYVASARKPLGRAFRQATKQMKLKKEEVVVIGDQLLTDILGGNRAGYYTILVVPIVQSDAAITKFNRKIERKILNRLRRKGKLKWED
ncbi:MAG TPA: YqeG family HAD IIIA-type phosphatase [Bacillota bacterium]|nr:YqeG family HAD IIIA-type phosphatase [Bacillota bacterium]